MKKKQLILQNSSLFAEIERKAGEIETQNIKIEELNITIKQLNEQNQNLNSRIAELSAENEDLKAQNERLLSDLENASSVVETPIEENNEAPIADNEVITQSAEEHTPNAETEEASPHMPPQTTPDLDTDIPKTTEKETSYDCVENTTPENTTTIHIATPKNTPKADILRAYGAEHIGKITRLTARILALANSDEATKNIVLGKNESFKLEILSLISKDGSVDDIKAKMDELAVQTAEYLNTIESFK